MKNKILIAVTLFVCTVASSCNNWLDVTPQAQVNADKLFSTPEGYESAVYGIMPLGTNLIICMNVPNTIITMEPPKT